MDVRGSRGTGASLDMKQSRKGCFVRRAVVKSSSSLRGLNKRALNLTMITSAANFFFGRVKQGMETINEP